MSMKKFEVLVIVIAAFIISVNCISCSDEDALLILSDKDQILDFTDEGGERTISFKINDEVWSISPTGVLPNWLSYTPQEGLNGDNVITIKVLRNIGSFRSHNLHLNAKHDKSIVSERKIITVNQMGTNDTSGTYTVELEAGTLSGIIAEDYISQVKELSLIGDLNGADILHLKKMLYTFKSGALSVLDLSNANIVEGGGNYELAANIKRFTSNDEIGERMFSCASNETDLLKSVILPNSIKIIGNSAFEGRRNLTTIIIPNNVTAIKKRAFYYCTKLQEVHVKTSTPPVITSTTFDEVTYNGTLYVPMGSINTYKDAEHWSKFNNIVEE